MFRTVSLPLWVLVLVLAFAAVTFASHFLFPSVRWFFRARAEEALSQLNARLDRPIDFFKLAARQDMIARLVYDKDVLEAVSEEAAARAIPGAVAFEEARNYAREIVPAFSTFLYFGFAARFTRWLSKALYRVDIEAPGLGPDVVDPQATVVFVMNHRSNMDYVLITWLAAHRSALSYAVGEWAHVWPLSALIRAVGAYFIRRRIPNPLYRRVLSRYVQITTGEGVTQGVFPEGRLSLDGRVGSARLGLLGDIVSGFDARKRDVVFLPVGFAYDRVLEDTVLTRAESASSRRFPGRKRAIMRFVLEFLSQRLRRADPPYGTAAAGFGKPVSLRDFLDEHPGAEVQDLAAHLMAEIERAVPVLPVPILAAALREGAVGHEALVAKIGELRDRLADLGADIDLPDSDEKVLAQAQALMIRRGILKKSGALRPRKERLLAFYAAPVEQRLGRAPETSAATRQT